MITDNTDHVFQLTGTSQSAVFEMKGHSGEGPGGLNTDSDSAGLDGGPETLHF